MVTGVGGGSYEKRLERLRRLRRHIDSLELRFAMEAAEFANLPEFIGNEWADSAISVLRDECRMPAGAAAQAICVGEQEDRLRFSWQALLDGRIGFRHLSLIAYTAENLTQSKSSKGFDGLALLVKAERLSVKGLIRACTSYRQQMDPSACLDEERAGAESRFLELKTDARNGAVWLRGWLENESGVLLRTALEPLSAPDGVDDHRSESRRQADALVELLGAGARPHVQVSATVESLAAIAGVPAPELELGMPISLEALRRHTCDCSLTRVLLDSQSLVIDVGRAKRTIGPAQRAALLKRDGGCRWPGCERPGRYCEGHHLKHWAKAGETVLANLVLLCRRHHFLVHEGGWELKGDVKTGFVAIPPRPWWLADLPAA